jgi:carbon storage regulator
MLVLSRKKDQVIWVGADIKITIVEVSRDKVRIGIDAPNDVAIARDELKRDEAAMARVSEVVRRRLADLDNANTGTPSPG